MENWGAAELRALFGGSADVAERQIMAGGQKLDVLFLDGLTSGGDIAEQVLRPLMQTVQPGSMQAVLAQAEQARVYCAVAERVTAPEDAADKLLHGYCVVVFPGTGAALCFETKTDTRRGPSAPESENTVKGAKDAFTETMRINTSLLRRHLRSAQLRFVQRTVGLRSQTAVTVCFLADLTDPALVRRMEQRLAAIDIDGMLTPASVEEYVTGSRKTAFPLLQYTERPDTFCQGLLNGQVGLLVDGLPLGYLAPVDLGILMKSTEDRAVDYISATCLRVLRYLALLAALLLPGLYVAMATYHQEMTTMTGIMSGAVTNTPGLGAAQTAYSDMFGSNSPNIALGYAVAYPLGVVGAILSFILIRKLFYRNGPVLQKVEKGTENDSRREEKEAEAAIISKHSEAATTKFISRRILISKRSLNGRTLEDLKFEEILGASITRVRRAGLDLRATPGLRLQYGDLVTVVGSRESVASMEKVLGNSMRRLDEPNLVPIFFGIALGVILGSIPIAFPGMPQAVKLGLAGGPLIVSILISYFGPPK